MSPIWNTPRFVKVRRHGPGTQGTHGQTVGRSQDGMTTRILALTGTSGNLVRFWLMPGQRHDSVEVPPLIDGIAFDGLIANEAFASNALVAESNGRGARIVISQHPGRAQKLGIDADIYAWRHLIENFFCKPKEFKRIALRPGKPDRSFEAMAYGGSAVLHG